MRQIHRYLDRETGAVIPATSHYQGVASTTSEAFTTTLGPGDRPTGFGKGPGLGPPPRADR